MSHSKYIVHTHTHTCIYMVHMLPPTCLVVMVNSDDNAPKMRPIVKLPKHTITNFATPNITIRNVIDRFVCKISNKIRCTTKTTAS